MSDGIFVSKVVKQKYLLLAFFFGFVVLLPFVALLPLVDLETLVPFVAALAPLVAAMDLFRFVVELDPFRFVVDLDPCCS